jgi:hypothetical protein
LNYILSEYVDIVNDTIAEKDYKEQEDPKLFKSNKTGRGPLGPDWVDNLRKNQKEKKITYMCAYKLCRVECSIWGLQAKLEKMICESGIYFKNKRFVCLLMFLKLFSNT